MPLTPPSPLSLLSNPNPNPNPNPYPNHHVKVLSSATKDSDAASMAEALLQSGSAAPQWLAEAATPTPRGGRRGGGAPQAPSAAALVAELKQQPGAHATCAALSVLLSAVRQAVGRTAVGLDAAAFNHDKQGWAAHLAYEEQQRHDPVEAPWVELQAPRGADGEWEAPPITEGREGPRFRPRPGAAPLGGPSAHLKKFLKEAGAARAKDAAASAERRRQWDDERRAQAGYVHHESRLLLLRG